MSKTYKREWLNPVEGAASIEWEVEDNGYGYTDARVHIRDCYRTISLEFGFPQIRTSEQGDEPDLIRNREQATKERTESLDKIDTLISELLEFREHLLAAPTEKVDES